MAPITYRPLTQWPPHRARLTLNEQKSSPFQAAWNTTLRDLGKELDLANGAGAVMQVDVVNQRDIRGDGWMSVDVRTRTSAVVLVFEKSIYDERSATHRTVPVTIACDAFDSWRDNVRAIMLGLRDLRRLDRYGIVQQGEQYRGFAALPSSTVPAMSTEQAAEAIRTRQSTTISAAHILGNVESARTAYREARAKAHPDSGGSSIEFNIVQEAARVLAAHHGVEKL